MQIGLAPCSFLGHAHNTPDKEAADGFALHCTLRRKVHSPNQQPIQLRQQPWSEPCDGTRFHGIPSVRTTPETMVPEWQPAHQVSKGAPEGFLDLRREALDTPPRT